MKFPSETWRRWHAHRARNQARRRSGRQSNEKAITLFRDGRQFSARGYPYKFAPADFRLVSNSEQILEFLSDVRYAMRVTNPRRLRMFDAKRRADPFRPAGKPRRIGRYISFDRIEQIDPPGALVLAAEFDRARQRFRARLPAVNVERWHPFVRSTLTGLGFFRLLDIGGEPPSLSLTDQQGVWRVYPFVSDRLVDPEKAGGPLRDLATALGVSEDTFFNDMALRQLYRSVIDCMNNVFDHAYPADAALFPHVARWWLTGAVDLVNRRLTMSMYDQGVTIPSKLTDGVDRVNESAKKGLTRLIRNQARDSEFIQYAVESHVTTTGDEQRGRGLGKLKEFVDACQTGELRILSRRGVYNYVKGQQPSLADMTSSLGGTLISWQVSL